MDMKVQPSSLANPEVRALLGDWGLGRWGAVVDIEEFEPPFGAFFEARIGDQVCGCVGLRRWSTSEAEVKRLFVAEVARGQNLGGKLLAAAVQAALALGYDSIVLDTDGSSAAALALFRSQRFVAVADYNGNGLAKHWFRRELLDRRQLES